WFRYDLLTFVPWLSSITLFPYTTLFRSCLPLPRPAAPRVRSRKPDPASESASLPERSGRALPQSWRAEPTEPAEERAAGAAAGRDRKSTRLNSSHVAISYAVFCLKKKN